MKTIADEVGTRHLMPCPITQSVTSEQKAALENEHAIAIKCSAVSDDILAIISKPVFFANRKEEICSRTFGCWSQNHPKAQTIVAQGDWLVSGLTRFTKRITFNDGIDKYRMTPSEIQE